MPRSEQVGLQEAEDRMHVLPTGLQWVLLIISIFCAVFAAAVEARRLLLAVAFQTKYSDRISFPRAVTAPKQGFGRALVAFLAGPKAWEDSSLHTDASSLLRGQAKS